MKCSVYLSLIATSILSSASGQEGGYKENYEPSPYHYEYKVHDNKEYLDFGAEEEGDGKGDVHGQYHVQLPDGRLQHVSYHVDDYNGYIADVSYDGHAEHPSYHQSHRDDQGHHHDGGHRFGKTLVIVDDGLSLNINEGNQRLGKTISTPSEDHIISNGFTNSRGGKAIGQEHANHISNQFHAKPVQPFPSSGQFSQRFGEPSNTFSGSSGTEHKQSVQSFPSISDFSTQFGKPALPGSSGQFNTGFEKPANSFFSRRPIEPEQSHVSKPKESFDIKVGSPVKTFSSFGNQPIQQENSFFSNNKIQQPAFSRHTLNSASTLSSQSTFGNEPIKEENSFFNSGRGQSSTHVKESFSRHGKSGRQDLDSGSSNLFGASSHPKPVVHVKSTNEKKDINPPEKITSIFGEPKTNNVFDSVGKSSRPDFESFSPIFGKSSNSKGFLNQPKKSFDSFSPIFGKESAGPKKHTSEAAKSDTDFFKPSGSFSGGSDKPERLTSFKKSEPFNNPVGSSRYSVRPASLKSRPGNPVTVAPISSTKQLPASNNISHTEPAQSAPRFKARAIGFGRNHPVLKGLDSHGNFNDKRGSVGKHSAIGNKGSFRQQTDRRQFGRALFNESVRQEGSVQQKSQEPENNDRGHKTFITHKAVPV